MNNCLKPSTSLLCKLGSMAMHFEEGLSKKGHEFDLRAIDELLNDSEVKEWLAQMDKLALLPRKR